MKNRPNDKERTALNANYSTKSVPSAKEVINLLLDGHSISHQAWITRHNGEQHRLGIAVFKLRKKYGFRAFIECPRDKEHPLYCCYYIPKSKLAEARKLAMAKGLIISPQAKIY